MKLPYAGEKSCSIIKFLKKYLKKTLAADILTKATTTSLKETLLKHFKSKNINHLKMFKKNQSNWNFSINTVMYSCITIRAGTNRTPKMERIAKMVNSLSR